jgi:hypothetical protein
MYRGRWRATNLKNLYPTPLFPSLRQLVPFCFHLKADSQPPHPYTPPPPTERRWPPLARWPHRALGPAPPPVPSTSPHPSSQMPSMPPPPLTRPAPPPAGGALGPSRSPVLARAPVPSVALTAAEVMFYVFVNFTSNLSKFGCNLNRFD